ncbi:MAG: glycosyltransferase family 9 protein [Bacteroidetes bacterium]|nr:glycosyltransferase family 9 protein [Bacteroidota bacterium]
MKFLTWVKRFIFWIIDILRYIPLKLIDYFFIGRKISCEDYSLFIIKLDEIGDYILFRNFLEILANSNRFKAYNITLCGNVIWKEIAEKIDFKYINNFVWLNKNRYVNNILYRNKINRMLYKKKFKVVINASYSRSFFLDDAIVNLINAEKKVGFSTDLSNLFSWQRLISDKYYNCLIDTDKIAFEFYKNGFLVSKILDEEVKIYKPSIDCLNLKCNIRINEEYVTFYLGGRKDYKRWNIENFVKVAEYIHQNSHYKIIILGAKTDLKYSNKFKLLFKQSIIIDLIGKTSLIDIIKILFSAKFLLCNDSGIAHISAAVGTSTVVLLNGTHFGRFFPYPEESKLNVFTIYPDKITDRMNDIDYLKQKYEYRSPLAINTISVDTVKSKIEGILGN